jgi:hypothetical protein
MILTTLSLEDQENYYLIVSDNSASFTDVEIHLQLPHMLGTAARQAAVLNEAWNRTIAYSEDAGDWRLDKHSMCFGDINIWVIPKTMP